MSDYPKDAVVAELIALIKKRADEGMEKYGTPMTRTDLQAGFWQHAAIEEMIDFLLYFLRLRRTRAEAEAFVSGYTKTIETDWDEYIVVPHERVVELLDFIYGTGKRNGKVSE